MIGTSGYASSIRLIISLACNAASPAAAAAKINTEQLHFAFLYRHSKKSQALLLPRTWGGNGELSAQIIAPILRTVRMFIFPRVFLLLNDRLYAVFSIGCQSAVGGSKSESEPSTFLRVRTTKLPQTAAYCTDRTSSSSSSRLPRTAAAAWNFARWVSIRSSYWHFRYNENSVSVWEKFVARNSTLNCVWCSTVFLYCIYITFR